MECDIVQIQSCFAALRTFYRCFGFKEAQTQKLLLGCFKVPTTSERKLAEETANGARDSK